MNKFKRSAKVLLVICLALAVSGCVKCVSTDYKNVEVRITDEYHRDAYSTPIRIGKTMSMIYHAAIYRITVEYNGDEYVINGRSTYEKYNDKVGEFVIGKLRVRTYDDETTKYDIIGLSDDRR